jgi:hypothetical protein
MAYRGLGALPVPVPQKWSPVFLIGCGRSGTTIIGKILNQHRSICLLNEPRHLWRAINRDTDIWYDDIWYDGVNEGGKLSLGASDVQDGESMRANRMFYLRQIVSRQPLLVEKLPINSFRIAYLRQLFPKCRIIHLLRHGLEVAHSIARTGPRWYGANDSRKWRALTKYGLQHGLSVAFLKNCKSSVERGLVEWTLSVEAVHAAREEISEDCFLEIRYDEWLDEATTTCRAVEQFLQLDRDAAMEVFANFVLHRNSARADELIMPEQVCSRTTNLLTRLGFK